MINLILQFVLELVRAMVIDELSPPVRRRARRLAASIRLRFHRGEGQALAGLHKLPTEKDSK